MKINIKNIIVHIVVGVVFFVAFLIIFDRQINKDTSNALTELANASYPMMEIGNSVQNYNLMNGYQTNIDLSLVRNQYTVIDNSGELNLRIHNYEYDITAVKYALLENDEEHVIEEGTLNKLDVLEKENVRTGSIVLKSQLKDNQTYYLKMTIRLNRDTKIYFYTKIICQDIEKMDTYFEFIKSFHEALFDKTQMENYSHYLEPTASTSDRSFQYVTIHNTADMVFFGNMEVKQVGQPVYFIHEFNDTYAVIRMKSVLLSKVKEDKTQYYSVDEIYKVRHVQDRMYLLDYRRTMNAFYDYELIDSANNYLCLGIQNYNNIKLKSSDEGRKVAFIENRQLWYYDYSSSNVYQIYSGISENMGDLHNFLGNYNIKLLKFEEDSISYIVYGYMNRGKNEGKNGIAIMKYDFALNCNEEIAFLEISSPYEELKKDVEKLTYLNSQNIFYCILGGDLHEVDLTKQSDKILQSNLVNESITTSKNQQIIAIEQSSSPVNNTEIKITDLEIGNTQSFSCKGDQRIRAVGFLSNDFIYGIASKKDISVKESGLIVFPMSTLNIVNIDGENVKSYKKKNRYITTTSLNGNVLEMVFSKKSGNKFVETNDMDFIRYKEENTSDKISVVQKYSETYKSQLYLSFPEYVYIQIEPDFISTKIMASEKKETLYLNKNENASIQYVVYVTGEEKGTYTNVVDAIKVATTERGIVYSNEEKLIWQCIFPDYAQVAGMDSAVKVSSASKSLQGCISMMASANGKSISPNKIEVGGKSVEKLIKEYLECEPIKLVGCQVDDMLYYVSKGCPVLAKYKNNHYVLVMSYNTFKIRYLDPVTGESIAVSRDQLTGDFEKAGNVFYSYLSD